MVEDPIFLREITYGIHSLPREARKNLEATRKGKALLEELMHKEAWQGHGETGHLIHKVPLQRATYAAQMLARVPKSSEKREQEAQEKREVAAREATIEPIPEIAEFNAKTVRNRVKTLLYQQKKPWHVIMDDVLDFLESILEDAELIAPLDDLLIDEYFEKLEDAWRQTVNLERVNLNEAAKRRRRAHAHVRSALNTLDKLLVENKARRFKLSWTRKFVRNDLEPELEKKGMPIVKARMYDGLILEAYDLLDGTESTEAKINKLRDMFEEAADDIAKGG